MDILEIYQQYQIMPQQAEHQVRVAAVADLICDNLDRAVNKRDIVIACLLHDMGNLIKYQLKKTHALFPGAYTEAEIEQWEKVQIEFKNKYGNSEHEAALVIARELGVSEQVVGLIDCIGFHTAAVNAAGSDMSRKVCAYSDMRVWPYGVTSLEHRIADLRVRYDQKFHHIAGNDQQRENFENSLRLIERQIFAHCKIRPEDITEQAIISRKVQLKKFQI